MQKELSHVSDLLDAKGVKEEDEIFFAPLFGRKRTFKLLRSRIDFVTSNISGSAELGYHKILDSLEKERLHYRLEAVKTLGRNRSLKNRYRLKTLQGSPFKHNGCFVNEAFLELGDKIELGHNILEARPGAPAENDGVFPDGEESGRMVRSDLPVLICGETGSGKTTLAKKIHALSRPDKPFVHLNISSFSKNLLESELFGHVKGAFTGALCDKEGAFREARNGTLFLDEIDSLPAETQTKLLIFLDEFKIRPVGSAIERSVSCRLICASGSNLKDLVKKGAMRRDFYYRIASGLGVDLPSLRYNGELVERLCQSFCLDNKVSMTPNLLDFYKTLPWPGNIRQLYGHLKKKVVYANSSKLSYDKFDERLAAESSDLSALSFKDEESVCTLEDVKREYVKAMYFKCNQNAAATAKRLDISPRTVKNMLEKNSLEKSA